MTCSGNYNCPRKERNNRREQRQTGVPLLGRKDGRGLVWRTKARGPRLKDWAPLSEWQSVNCPRALWRIHYANPLKQEEGFARAWKTAGSRRRWTGVDKQRTTADHATKGSRTALGVEDLDGTKSLSCRLGRRVRLPPLRGALFLGEVANARVCDKGC